MYDDTDDDDGDRLSLLAQRILQQYLKNKSTLTTTIAPVASLRACNSDKCGQDNSTLVSWSSYYKVEIEYNQTHAPQHPLVDSLSSSLVHLSRYASSTDSNQSVLLQTYVLSPNDATVERPLFFVFAIGIVLAILILATMVGNALVIAAILRERHLRSVGNYLVFSLAVADLMVACFVMPLGALYAVTDQWTFGAEFCDLWTVADVLCCTASILHLLAIAMDRYWAVTNVDYIHQRRNSRRIGLMIFLIWFTSLIISLAPVFGWRDENFHQRISQKQCLISQDVLYQIVATCSSFYLPLLFILILYWKIFKVARKRIRHKPGNKVPLVALQTTNQGSVSKIVTGKKSKQSSIFKLNCQHKKENHFVPVANFDAGNTNNNNNNNNNTSIAKSIAKQRLMRLYGKDDRPCPSISENDCCNNEVAEELHENYLQGQSCHLNDCICDQLNTNMNIEDTNTNTVRKPDTHELACEERGSLTSSSSTPKGKNVSCSDAIVMFASKHDVDSVAVFNSSNVPLAAANMEGAITPGASSSTATTSSERPLMHDSRSDAITVSGTLRQHNASSVDNQTNSEPTTSSSQVLPPSTSSPKACTKSNEYSTSELRSTNMTQMIDAKSITNKTAASSTQLTSLTIEIVDKTATLDHHRVCPKRRASDVVCSNLDPESLLLHGSLQAITAQSQIVHQKRGETASSSLVVCPIHNKANSINDQATQWQTQKMAHKESIESKREKKAAKTLAIITGVFVICWLPFFINALLSPLWQAYQNLVPSLLNNIFLWLGYINSGVNPIIFESSDMNVRERLK